MTEFLFLSIFSDSGKTNHLLLKSFFNHKKPISFTEFSKFAKRDIENLFKIRFYKKQDLDIRHELIRENGIESVSS